MLDRAKLIKQLTNLEHSLFRDDSHELKIAQKIWQKICDDPTICHKVQHTPSEWLVPSWQGTLGRVLPIQKISAYHALSVDGSQIYPDRHQGTGCFLINLGSVAISYGGQGGVLLETEPRVFADAAENITELNLSGTELVNALRQEFELEGGVELARRVHAQHKNEIPRALIYDGSLIFWHLNAQDQAVKQHFVQSYCAILHQMYDEKLLCASYISAPKGKEVVNVLRMALCDFNLDGCTEYQKIEHIVDAAVANFYLKPGTRSIVFKSNSSICALYPPPLAPHFFYVHNGFEIGRVELPAWIANDESLVDTIAAIMLDQSIKGGGYPVVIAEAHEQAVVKGPDREFFYHLIAKFGIAKKRRIFTSIKSQKKRGIGI